MGKKYKIEEETFDITPDDPKGQYNVKKKTIIIPKQECLIENNFQLENDLVDSEKNKEHD